MFDDFNFQSSRFFSGREYSEYGTYLYYAAPLESRQFIETEGILPPCIVHERIKQGLLPQEVLGISFGGLDGSNMPEYVSLLPDSDLLDIVAEHLCYSRHHSYYYPNFRAVGYAISTKIVSHPQFRDNDFAHTLHSDPYPREVLYKGIIPTEFIEDVFCVRSHFR